MKYWRNILGGLAVSALIYPVVLYCGQKHLYLFPDKGYVSPESCDMQMFREMPFASFDGMRIMGWYVKGDDDKPALLFFHGNTGQIALFAPAMKTYADAGYTVYMSEYRGFGGTPGDFTQQALYEDAQAAYDFLHDALGHRDIIAYGYSMGTAAAAAAAGKRAVSGLILAAPFYSLKKIAGEKNIPLATMALKYELPSYSFIKNYRRPLLVVHGDEDTLIPPQHGQDLFALAPAKDKTLMLMKGQSHNALFFGDKAHTAVLGWLAAFKRNKL